MSLHDRDYMREGPRPFRPTLRGITAFHVIFGLCLAVFFAQWVLELGWERDPVTRQLEMPAGGVSLHELSEGRVWTLFSYMFVHGGPWHLLVNLLMLWFAGKRVQDLYGGRRFLQIFVLSGIVGAALEMAVAAYAYDSTRVTLIGASASCMGLLLALAVALPREEITALLYFVIPVRMRLATFAKVMVLLNLGLAALSVVQMLPDWLTGGSMVAYFAHVGGAVAGAYYARAAGYDGETPELPERPRPDLERRPRRPQMARAVRQPVVDVDVEAVRRRNPTNDPVVDLIRDEVDPILDKISEQGMTSLTDEERKILERASRQMLRRESRRS